MLLIARDRETSLNHQGSNPIFHPRPNNKNLNVDILRVIFTLGEVNIFPMDIALSMPQATTYGQVKEV